MSRYLASYGRFRDEYQEDDARGHFAYVRPPADRRSAAQHRPVLDAWPPQTALAPTVPVVYRAVKSRDVPGRDARIARRTPDAPPARAEPRKEEGYKVTIIRIIGQGSFGAIREVVVNHERYAMKSAKKDDEVALAALTDESRNFRTLIDHAHKGRSGKKDKSALHMFHLISCLIFADDTATGELRLFLRLAHGSMWNLIQQEQLCDHWGPPRRLPLKNRMFMSAARQMAVALKFVHSAGLVHYDVKPDNILYIDTRESGYHFLLSDFGEMDYAPKWSLRNFKRGTPQYMAPELVRGGLVQPTFKVDMFSLGITLQECAGMGCGESECDFQHYREFCSRLRNLRIDSDFQDGPLNSDDKWLRELGVIERRRRLAEWSEFPPFMRELLEDKPEYRMSAARLVDAIDRMR